MLFLGTLETSVKISILIVIKITVLLPGSLPDIFWGFTSKVLWLTAEKRESNVNKAGG